MSSKLNSLLFSSALALCASQANASIVTWDILTTYHDLRGTITFDNAPITGLVDGAYDVNDTHIYGATLNLVSTNLGINHTITNAIFQPLTNTYDNKHIDSCYPCTVLSSFGSIYLTFSAQSDQGSPAVGASEYYLNVGGYNAGTYRWAFTDHTGVNNPNNLPKEPLNKSPSLTGAAIFWQTAAQPGGFQTSEATF